MKAVIVNSPEEAEERAANRVSLYMSRSVGVQHTKDKVKMLREDGFEIVDIEKPLYIATDMFHIYYKKSKELKEKDARELKKQLSAQPSVDLVPNFSSDN